MMNARDVPEVPPGALVSIAFALTVAACGSTTTPLPSPTPPQPTQPDQPEPPYAAQMRDKCARHDETPVGTPDEYTTPVLAGFAIAEPITCKGKRAYIRVERLHGGRRLGTRVPRPHMGFREGCMEKPARIDDTTDCPVLNFAVPAGEVREELRRRGANSGGPGLGPCGDVHSDEYSAWNMSVSVMSWSDAEAAVQLMAQALDRYDVAGYVGISVVGPTCNVRLL